jgi:predicted DNA binding CopG/RHH family protein
VKKLSTEERELQRSVEAEEWRSVGEKAKELARYREAAKQTFRKDRRLNIRISTRDLEALQKRAMVEGIPYQTLVASVLHKYVSGRLKESGS